MTEEVKFQSLSRCFGGELRKYQHVSSSVGGLPMSFNMFLPRPLDELQANTNKIPVIFYLSGLTCTEDNVMQKSGLQRAAAQRGVAVVAPDTSPRKTGILGEDSSWDFGTGAGFYLNATQEPWSKHFRMYDYVSKELYDLLFSTFSFFDKDRVSIFGHSMGGLGAITIAFKNPEKFKVASAFAPISHPSSCSIGSKAFSRYLGDDKSSWIPYDPTELAHKYEGRDLHLLVDQGTEDAFYKDKTLLPEDFIKACETRGIPLKFRWQKGYDHSYYFVSTFIDDHINHHADLLSS